MPNTESSAVKTLPSSPVVAPVTAYGHSAPQPPTPSQPLGFTKPQAGNDLGFRTTPLSVWQPAPVRTLPALNTKPMPKSPAAASETGDLQKPIFPSIYTNIYSR
jgi:hypothetical protein